MLPEPDLQVYLMQRDVLAPRYIDMPHRQEHDRLP
jgi:hypothetical protein